MAEQLPACPAETGSVIAYSGTYAEYKQEVDQEIRSVAEGFIRIGYLLKIARDTNILFESGYGSVAEFAQAEYGLTKDVVSRYIAINDRYSEGGYSDQLQERFRGFGVAKLAEMLTLPDSVIEAIGPELTKSQIREVKEEVKAEQQITPIEAALEPKDERTREMKPLELFLFEYFRKDPFKFRMVHEYTMKDSNIHDDRMWIEHTLDAMCPSGNGCEVIRIPGKGRYMLFFHGREKPLELVEVREDVKEEISWSVLRENILRMCCRHEDPARAWMKIYEEEFPKEQEEKTEVQEDAGISRENAQKAPENAQNHQKSAQDHQEGAHDARKNVREAKVAPAQPEEPAYKTPEPAEESGEMQEPFMNPPEEAEETEHEVIPPERTEVEYDFWRARKTVQEGINELRRMFMDADWEGMETKLSSLLRKVKEIRKEIPDE